MNARISYALNFTQKGRVAEIFGHNLLPLCQIDAVLAEECPYKVTDDRYDQGSVILSQTLDRHALRKSQRTGRAGDDAYPEYFDSFQRKCLHLTVMFCCLAEEISLCYHQRYTYARSDHFKARTCKQMSYLFLRNFVGYSYAIITFWIAFGL